MKVAIILACLAVGTFAFSHENINLDNLVPIYETIEFQKHYPGYANLAKQASFSNERNPRIWNGRLAQLGELPYQVGIVILLSQQSFCGGSIVSANFVLSAASCFPGDPNAVIEIGHVNRALVPTFINAAQKTFHPGFDFSANANDMVLIRTVIAITFNDNVRPVRLPNRRQVAQTFENQQGRISGWGATGTGDSAPNQHLRIGFARVISQLTCTIRFPNSVNENTICIEGDNVNFCNGDFGGPLTVQDADGITTQVGVKSFLNILGCTFGFPGGFTRVSRYLDWIGQNSDVIIRDDF